MCIRDSSESVLKRKQELDSSQSIDIGSDKQLQEEKEEDDKISINLESVILLENKLYRVLQNVKTIRFADASTPNVTTAAINQYELQYQQLVELCEDYWYILRIELNIFDRLPA